MDCINNGEGSIRVAGDRVIMWREDATNSRNHKLFFNHPRLNRGWLKNRTVL